MTFSTTIRQTIINAIMVLTVITVIVIIMKIIIIIIIIVMIMTLKMAMLITKINNSNKHLRISLLVINTCHILKQYVTLNKLF